MPNNNCALRVAHLEKRYGDFALGPVTLEVQHGSVVGLIGQNGAGKTTLMKAVLGMLVPTGGRVELFGCDTSELGERELARLRAQVGYVASECAYPLDMTVGEVARMHELAYPAFSRQAFAELCARLGLGDHSRKVSDLSRGMGMKLQLISMLAANVHLLVLDEPTAGLDPVVRNETLDVLRQWMEPGDRSILISSHITSDLTRLADHLVMLHEGRVVLSGDQDEIAAMGVARLRATELARVLEERRLMEGELRLLRHDLSSELLVPSRAAFLRRYPDYVCDPATIDDIMAFFAKGEVR